MADLPIACSLDAAGQEERAAAFGALAERALVEREPTPRGWRLLYRDAAGVEDTLRSLIAAESRCCPFLDFALERSDEHLALTVEGPPSGRELVETLFATRPPR